MAQAIRPIAPMLRRVLACCAIACVMAAPGIAFAEDAAVPSAKDETVYVYANADGSTKKVEVSTVLKNPGAAQELADSSMLSGIKAEGDDQSLAGAGSSMVWHANGKNVTYTGTSSAPLPVSIRVTYQLDGLPISPDDLAGKSGNVSIRFDYENLSPATATVNGTSQAIYTPFTCITTLLLDGNDFSNVHVENGKLIEDGDDIIVVGYAVPGLKQSLGSMVADSDVPDHFSVSADVSSFELKSTMTIVTAGLMADVDTADLGLGDLGKTDELVDGMKQLISGACDLSNGLDELAEGANALNDGTGALTTGAGALGSGLSALAYGTDEAPGLADAADGAAELAYGLGEIDGALQAIADKEAGLPVAASALESLASAYGDEGAKMAAAQQELMAFIAANPELDHEAIDGMLMDAMAMSTYLKEIAPGVKAASDGIEGVSSALSEAASGAQVLPAGLYAAVDAVEQLRQGAVQLEAGAVQFGDATGQLASGAQQAADGSRTLEEGMQEFNDRGITTLVDTIERDYGGLLDRVKGLSNAAKAYDTYAGLTAGTEGSVKFVFQTDGIVQDEG